MNQCKTCRYFNAHDNREGECRKGPPKAVLGGHGYWALVFASDWCGAYREKGQRQVDDRELGID